MNKHSNSRLDKELCPLSMMSQIRDSNFYEILEPSSSQDDAISSMEIFCNKIKIVVLS